MRASMQGVYHFNLFGVNMIGADICGLKSNATVELCTRWHVLGAFYPFTRNHNNNDTISQEPYVWTQQIPGRNITYTDAIRKAIVTKYCLLKYYYTELFYISKLGGMFIKPLFFEFPEDNFAYGNEKDSYYVEQNIMIGSALKFSPSLSLFPNETEKYYFPAQKWIDLFTNRIIQGPQMIYAQTQYDQIRLHLREGFIIPWQDASNITRSYNLFQTPTSLIVLLNEQFQAEGKLVLDDGYSTNKELYNEYQFKMLKQQENIVLSVEKLHLNPEKQKSRDESIGFIRILDAASLKFSKRAYIQFEDGTKKDISLNFDGEQNRLELNSRNIGSDYQEVYWQQVKEIVIVL